MNENKEQQQQVRPGELVLGFMLAESKARTEGVRAANDWASMVGGKILAETTRRRGSGLVLLPGGH